ncbi:MAG: hypothetical protein M3Q18_14260, partial [Actinomycetota bacterium]|nr:hypothetical protein [Actinomycetota bacterium]
MTDLEARLRNSMSRKLDPIEVAPHLPIDVARHACARRAVTMLGSGMAVVVSAVAVAWMASALSS